MIKLTKQSNIQVWLDLDLSFSLYLLFSSRVSPFWIGYNNRLEPYTAVNELFCPGLSKRDTRVRQNFPILIVHI